MKRMICLVLAAMLLLTGCGGEKPAAAEETVPTETRGPILEVPTEPPAEPGVNVLVGEIPENGAVSAEELLRKEGTVTVTFETREEYEQVLHDLGYREFMLGYHVDMHTVEVLPKSLTYNDEAFRLELSANCNPIVNGTTDLGTVKQYDGWVLYGMKSEKACNITELDYQDFEGALCFDFFDNWRFDKLRQLDIFPAFYQNECYDLDDRGQYTRWACHEIRYYPYTGNLYNLVNVVEDMEIGPHGAPRMLVFWEKALVDAWSEMGLPFFEIYPGRLDANNKTVEGGNHIGLSNTEYTFEPGMTMEEWVNSPYNMDGWRYVNDALGGTMVSPERNYAILVDRDPAGNALALDDYRNSVGGYSLFAVSYEAYKALVDSLAVSEG